MLGLKPLHITKLNESSKPPLSRYLLQNQQGMLKQLIEEQKSMKALQDTMKIKQDELETKLEGLVIDRKHRDFTRVAMRVAPEIDRKLI